MKTHKLLWEYIKERTKEIIADLGDWDFKMFFLFVSCFSFAGLMSSGILAGLVVADRNLT